jgi:hypothetical protein
MTNLSVSFDPAAFGSDIANLKRAATGVENAVNRAGRSAFAALLTGGMDKAQITVAVLATYGNPKTAAGKASNSLSVLRTVGAEPVEKAFNAIFAIHAKTIAGDDDCEMTKAHRAAIRAAIVGYVLEEKGAPVRLYGLKKAIDGLDKAHVEAMMPAVAEEKAKEEAAETQAETQPEAVNRLDMIKAFHALIADKRDFSDMELLALEAVMSRIEEIGRAVADEKIAANG